MHGKRTAAEVAAMVAASASTLTALAFFENQTNNTGNTEYGGDASAAYSAHSSAATQYQ